MNLPEIILKSESRGYRMVVDRDLFGAFVLYRQWYGLYTRKKGMMSQVFLSKDHLVKEIYRVSKLRQRHKYCVAVDTIDSLNSI